MCHRKLEIQQQFTIQPTTAIYKNVKNNIFEICARDQEQTCKFFFYKNYKSLYHHILKSTKNVLVNTKNKMRTFHVQLLFQAASYLIQRLTIPFNLSGECTFAHTGII